MWYKIPTSLSRFRGMKFPLPQKNLCSFEFHFPTLWVEIPPEINPYKSTDIDTNIPYKLGVFLGHLVVSIILSEIPTI